MIERIKNCKDFEFIKDKIDSMMDPSNFIGRSVQQVEEFISEDVDPILEKNKDLISKKSQELNVKIKLIFFCSFIRPIMDES